MNTTQTLALAIGTCLLLAACDKTAHGTANAAQSKPPATDQAKSESTEDAGKSANETIRIKWSTPTDGPHSNGIFSDALNDLSYTNTGAENQLVSFVVTVQGSDEKNMADLDVFGTIVKRGQHSGAALMMAAGLAADNADLSGKIRVSVAVYSTTEGAGNKTLRGTQISNMVEAELNKTYTRNAGTPKMPTGALHVDPK